MDNKKLVAAWHKHILAECKNRLGRELTDAENLFVTSRGGFIALELIEDTVMANEGDVLAEYLNSENQDSPANSSGQD